MHSRRSRGAEGGEIVRYPHTSLSVKITRRLYTQLFVTFKKEQKIYNGDKPTKTDCCETLTVT